MKLASLVGLAALAICMSCGPDPDTKMGVTVPVQDNSRITVTRVGVIADDLAYDEKRGIYVITDKQTGQEYVGVSGIGISELGSHHAGKAVVSDER